MEQKAVVELNVEEKIKRLFTTIKIRKKVLRSKIYMAHHHKDEVTIMREIKVLEKQLHTLMNTRW